jgi:hypothetical protein
MNYLTPFLHGGVYYVGVFLIVLTVLVFVHEFGHYWVARRNGVRIEVFSIGFGPELFGWWDRAGTRWKFSAIPLGGYVKMFGDPTPLRACRSWLGQLSPAEWPVVPRQAARPARGDRRRWTGRSPVLPSWSWRCCS